MTSQELLGWIVTVFIGLLALLVLWKILTDKINLQYLIADERGDASMSRFQFLVFTFVIAGGLAYTVLTSPATGTAHFPELPSGVFILLGISGGSYAIGKSLGTPASSSEPPKPEEKPNG